MMNSFKEENSGYVRVKAILKELGKENLLSTFKENELKVQQAISNSKLTKSII